MGIPWIFFILIIIIIGKSIYDFIQYKSIHARIKMKEGHFSLEIFIAMLIVYCITMVGYGLVYFILSFQGIVIVEHGELREVTIWGSVVHSIYFSGVTLLTLGYGDLAPVGIGRIIAISEALIGYILPAAFVLKVVQINSRDSDK
ncbi:potassium channel family protein [Oceanobacillus sp. CFH 90083]|uniref:potassium channel family protein n=1 Tax=Oceanobacillus sp. CFH 90083 TaxID=2592336 RepID=UPI00128E943C|nr:potassium channel family protein [Oceanobacillus sp. CFH 90083]